MNGKHEHRPRLIVRGGTYCSYNGPTPTSQASYREKTAASRSTATPSVNGTQQSSSLQPSRVVTPNGVRTPDWMLDCEICHKQGINVVSIPPYSPLSDTNLG